MKPKRIVFLSQLFDPEYSIKGLSFAKFLVENGYDVEAVTTFPSYPKGVVFDGYKQRLRQTTIEDGVKITRLWSFISSKRSKFSRVLSYLSFFVTATAYLLFTKRFDLLYAYHPQVTTGVSGRWIKLIRRIPFITDIQDLWPESLVAEGIDPESKVVSLIRYIVKPSLTHAEAVIVLSNGFKDYLVSQGSEAANIHVVHNWCPEESRYVNEQELPKELSKSLRPLHFFYTGNHGPLQALDTIIRAFSHFSTEQVKLTLVGQGSERENLMKLAVRLNADNINFFGFVSPTDLKELLTEADVLVCSLKDDPLFDITIPSKIQAYLCSGRPVLVAAGKEASKIIVDACAGITAEPGNVNSIVQAIEKFMALSQIELDVMSKNAKDFYFNNLAARHGYVHLLKVIDSVCTDKKGLYN